MDTIETWSVESENVAGLRFGIRIERDPDATPYEYDCFDDEAKGAWKRGDWEYVIVTVTPDYEGVSIDTCADSLGGIEWGFLPGADVRCIGRDQITDYPVTEMIANCMTQLRAGGLDRASSTPRAQLAALGELKGKLAALPRAT